MHKGGYINTMYKENKNERETLYGLLVMDYELDVVG